VDPALDGLVRPAVEEGEEEKVRTGAEPKGLFLQALMKRLFELFLVAVGHL